MGKSVPKSCNLCGDKVVKGGARQNRRKDPIVICESCLDRIYPERIGLPAYVDKDGNVYFVDSENNKVVLVFRYGPVPYSSYTEIDGTDEFEGCGGLFIR
jgi:hypothetical protein